MKELLNEFRDYLEKDHNPDTVKGYIYDINGYIDFLRDHFAVSDHRMKNYILTSSENDIYSYLSYLVTVQENSSSTINRKLSSIKKFYSYLFMMHRIPADFSRNIRSVRTSVKTGIFSAEELTEILQCVKGRNRYRDLTILCAFIYAGLSVNELLSLKMQDIKDGYITVVKEDGTSRRIRLNDAFRSVLETYTDTERHCGCDYLLSVDGINPMAKRTVHQTVVKYLKASGLYRKGMTTETLRKSGIYLLRKYADFDIGDVKNYLGLKSASSLKNYVFEEEGLPEDRINRIPISKLKL